MAVQKKEADEHAILEAAIMAAEERAILKQERKQAKQAKRKVS